MKTFLAIYRGILRTFTMEEILSVRSLYGFEEKVVVTVIELEFVCQTPTLAFSFKSVHVLFFFLRALQLTGVRL